MEGKEPGNSALNHRPEGPRDPPWPWQGRSQAHICSFEWTPYCVFSGFLTSHLHIRRRKWDKLVEPVHGQILASHCTLRNNCVPCLSCEVEAVGTWHAGRFQKLTPTTSIPGKNKSPLLGPRRQQRRTSSHKALTRRRRRVRETGGSPQRSCAQNPQCAPRKHAA